MLPVKGKLEELVNVLADADRLLILTHNNPDPDSIASAFALRHILSYVHKARIRLGYSGTVMRSENQAMIRLLTIPLREVSRKQVLGYSDVALVDVQPEGKNLIAPNRSSCRIVIDHHLSHKKKRIAEGKTFFDIRKEYGATSTILAEYIKENDIPMNARVSTALYYGISTDIGNRGRGHSDQDIKMMQYLFPKASLKWLRRIECAPIPIEYFIHYAHGIVNAFLIGDVVVSDLGKIVTADPIAEMADFLMKIKSIRWCLCLGSNSKRLFFSIRTTRKSREAGTIAYRLVGKRGSAGGHEQSAGGYLSIEGMSEDDVIVLRKELKERFCRIVGKDNSSGVRLLDKASEKLTRVEA